jgi:predicted GNAT family acetyltransferase
VVDLAVAREQLWVWDDRGPVSMSGASKATAGVARVQRVYTPPELRGRGYATACVEHQSRLLVERGLGCVLYTQLSNPTSNAIYQRIGYRPIAETLAYRFA